MLWWYGFKAWVDALANKQKLFRRSVLVASCMLWGWVTITLYTQLGAVTAPVAAIYGTSQVVFGLVLKWYFDTREKDSDS